MLRFSEKQEGALAYDVVCRHAQTQSVEIHHRLRSRPHDNPPGVPTEAKRLDALCQLLRDDVRRRAGKAAPHLLVDLDLCAAQWSDALSAGATWRESAASAQLLACASLGLLWLRDERFCVEADGPAASVVPAASSEDSAALKHWAETGWTDRYTHALARMKALQAPSVYALDRAVAQRFEMASVRNIADTVFPPDAQERLSRFVHEERRLFQQALRDGSGPVDPRLEALCMAADLVHGLGRFVRLAVSLRGRSPPVEFPHPHLVKAIGELAG